MAVILVRKSIGSCRPSKRRRDENRLGGLALALDHVEMRITRRLGIRLLGPLLLGEADRPKGKR
jgi:hypothetical protein